jgi:hypothetical protein
MSSRALTAAPLLRATRPLLAAFLLLVAHLAPCEDWAAFAARSTHQDDPQLIQTIASVDFDTRLSICRGIGGRADPFAGDIIDSFFARYSTRESYRDSLLLRELLAGLFDPARGDADVRARVIANESSLASMAGRLSDRTDPQLAGSLVRILPLMPPGTALSALMDVGARLTYALRRSGGEIPQQLSGLALDYLGAAALLKSQDTLEQCIEIARLSREKVIVDKARQTVRTLLAP